MSFKKKVNTKFTFQSLIRLIVFGVVIFLIINYISGHISDKNNISDPTVLGAEDEATTPINQYVSNISQKAYNALPQKSRDSLKNLPASPVIIQAQTNLNKLGGVSSELPNKIIIEVKKMIVKGIYDNIMKDLESKQ